MTQQGTHHPLLLGAHIPQFSLKGTDGQTYSPSSFSGKKGLAVIFLSTHCPYVGAWEDRIIAIAKEYPDLATVGINPMDSLEDMTEREYPFPYLHDGDQSVAQSFGASRTPEVFLFDEARTLRYHGAVDSDYEESAADKQYLRDALDRMLETGFEIYLPQTPVVGCPIIYQS